MAGVASLFRPVTALRITPGRHLSTRRRWRRRGGSGAAATPWMANPAHHRGRPPIRVTGVMQAKVNQLDFGRYYEFK